MKLLFHIEGKSGGSKEYKKDENVLDRIEEVREKLHNIISRNMSFNKEAIKLSQYLDKLIVEHIKGSQMDFNDEKQQKYNIQEME